VNRTRLSLYYLAGYLTIGGVALLLVPDQTLSLLLSNGHYGEVFPRLAGMFASGLGMSIAGIIRARAQSQYTGTLAVRSYFIVCLIALYWISRDPLFLVVLGVVVVGVVLTLSCYLADRAQTQG
jgi:CHASE2 domain-containing sensor protein